MERKTKYLIPILFFALMLFKVSSFHVYTHHDSSSDQIENCAICDVAIENQDVEFQLNSVVSVPNYQIFESIQTKIVVQNQVDTSFDLHFTRFGRPPPVTI